MQGEDEMDKLYRSFSQLAVAGVVLGCASAEAATMPFDALFRLVTLRAPSQSAVVTVSDSELKTILGNVTTFQSGDRVVLEMWVSDVGALNTGITGFFADISFDQSVLRADALAHSPGPFAVLTDGTIDNPAGAVVDFGGNDGSFVGQGVGPSWARLGYIDMTAIGNGVATIGSTLGVGGIGVLGRTPPPASEIDFDTVTIVVPEPSTSLFLMAGLFALSASGRRRPHKAGRNAMIDSIAA